MDFGPLDCVITNRNSNRSNALRNRRFAGQAVVTLRLTTLLLQATTASLRLTTTHYALTTPLQRRGTTVSLYYRLALALCHCSNFQRTRPGTRNQAAARGRLHIAGDCHALTADLAEWRSKMTCRRWVLVKEQILCQCSLNNSVFM